MIFAPTLLLLAQFKRGSKSINFNFLLRARLFFVSRFRLPPDDSTIGVMGFSASREVVVQVEERSSPGTIIIIALHCIIRLEAGAAQVAFFQRDRCQGEDVASLQQTPRVWVRERWNGAKKWQCSVVCNLGRV